MISDMEINCIGKCIIKRMHTVECSLLIIQEDQSVPVNQQIKTLCWELWFWVALTQKPAGGGTHSRACRWTQTPCALPLKHACVISTRSNRGYLWNPLIHSLVRLLPCRCFCIGFQPSPPYPLKCLPLLSLFYVNLILRKIIPKIYFSVYKDMTLLFKMIPCGSFEEKTASQTRLRSFQHLISHLFVSLFNRSSLKPLGILRQVFFFFWIQAMTNWKQIPAFNVQVSFHWISSEICVYYHIPCAFFVVSESDPNNQNSTRSDDRELRRPGRICR